MVGTCGKILYMPTDDHTLASQWLDMFDPFVTIRARDSNGTDWKHINRRPTVDDIMSSWEGRESIALRPASKTRLICLDFDDHGNENLSVIMARIDTWTDALHTELGIDPLLVSSPGQGIHLYLFVSTATDRDWLKSWIHAFAAHHCLDLQHTDVYPCNKGLRVPLEKSRDLTRITSRIVGRNYQPVTESHSVDIYELPAYIDAATTTLDNFRAQSFDVDAQVDSTVKPAPAGKSVSGPTLTRIPSARKAENYASQEQGIDATGAEWRELMARAEQSGVVLMGSTGGFDTARQLAYHIRVGQQVTGIALYNRLRSWADKAGLDSETRDYLYSLAESSAMNLESKISSGALVLAPQFGSSQQILGIDPQTPITARSVAYALLQEPEIREEILNRADLSHRVPTTQDRLHAVAKFWIDMIAECGTITQAQIVASHADGSKRVQISGKTSIIATVARKALESTGMIHRVCGHWAGGNGKAAKRARYGATFSDVLELRREMGLPIIDVEQVRDEKPAVKTAEKPSWLEIVEVDEVNRQTIAAALLDREVVNHLAAKAMNPTFVENSVQQLIDHGFVARDRIFLENNQIPVVWGQGEKRNLAFLDFRAIRKLRSELGLPPIRVVSADQPTTPEPTIELEANWKDLPKIERPWDVKPLEPVPPEDIAAADRILGTDSSSWTVPDTSWISDWAKETSTQTPRPGQKWMRRG